MIKKWRPIIHLSLLLYDISFAVRLNDAQITNVAMSVFIPAMVGGLRHFNLKQKFF